MKALHRRLWVVVKVTVGVALVVWLVRAVELERLVSSLRRTDPGFAVAGVALLWLSFFAQAARLDVLVGRLGARFRDCLRMTFGGFLFNQLLPGGLGGDGYRALEVRRLEGGWTGAVSLVVMERVVGLVCLVVPGAIAALAVRRQIAGALATSPLGELAIGPPGLLAIGLAVLGAAVGVWWFFREWLTGRLRRLLADQRRTFGSIRPRAYAAVVALSLAYHAIQVVANLCLLRAVGERVAFTDMLVVLTLVAATTLLPLSFGALGLKEGAFVAGLAIFGVGVGDGLAVALINRLVLLAAAVLGAALVLGRGKPGGRPPGSPALPTAPSRGAGDVRDGSTPSD